MFFPDRDVQHNISHSVLNENKEGGLLYTSVGEVNPIVTIDRNQFRDNCKKLYGNFTTCKAAVDMNVQNTQTIFFRVSYFCVFIMQVIGNLIIFLE